MPDQFKEVTKTGYGSRLVNSIKGIGFGILLFLGSFVLLYWNEGRVDVSEVAKNAVEVSSTEVAADMDGEFVYTTGEITTEESVGDGMYFTAGDYLAVTRSVEMYAWVEKTESTSETNMGGSETTETTYTYVQEWTGMPTKTSNFKYPEGHNNPELPFEGETFTVTNASIGAYDIEVGKLDLPGFEDVTLNEQNTELSGNAKLQGNYIYVPVGTTTVSVPTDSVTTTAEPQIGDVRVSYEVLNEGFTGTVFGKLDGGKIVKYVDTEDTGAEVYRLFDGTRDEALGQMHNEYTTMLWILRVVGFIMMSAGLGALFGPLSTLLDVVPFFGQLSRSIVGLISMVVSLVLTFVTIIVSKIAHSPLAIAVSVVVVLAVVAFVLKKKGQRPTVVKA